MEKSSNSNKNTLFANVSTERETDSPNTRLRSRARKRKRGDSETSETSVDSDGILPENALEVERNLQASAIKNNLDEASVKKILKKVVTNDHVLALVKLREEEELSSAPEQRPAQHTKITRAKAKELMKVAPQSAPWNLELTPIKHIPVKTRPEVKALIAQELPEDEDDEEYEPTNDDVPSDDDQVSCSDLDSQPRTPATPGSVPSSSPRVLRDGPFKVPQSISTPTRRKLITSIEEEEATIALRTRSKLSLSETPIEHIESSFVPPDDIPTPVGDDLWNKFLEECLNPAEVSKNEDDDDADPEYNVAADPDAHDDDEEALENSLIKISKKELNDLVTELFNIMPEATDDEIALASNMFVDNSSNSQIPNPQWQMKQEPLSDEETEKRPSKIIFEKRNSITRVSVGKTEPEDLDEAEERDEAIEQTARRKETEPNRQPSCVCVVRDGIQKQTVSTKTSIDISMQEQHVDKPTSEVSLQPPPVVKNLTDPLHETGTITIEIDKPGVILPAQVQILQQQLRMHVQLCAANFLQLFVNPVHWSFAPPYKGYLEQLEKVHEENPESVVNVCNLKPALDLVRSWEKTVSEDTPENQKMVAFIKKEADRARRRSQNHTHHVGEFPDMFKEVIANSTTVFLYPYLLPSVPYRPDAVRRNSYRGSEDKLIVLGIDQFWRHVEENPDLFPRPSVKPHPRHRWGLAASVRLICKHMMPWLTPNLLLCHIIKAKKERDGVISKYFKTGKVEPVEHKLLPFNPNLTLYEQPEHEMPRVWIRYLSKNSKRFRDYFYKRVDCGQPPQGVPIELGAMIPAPQKTALPIDFTKVIECNRQNLRPKVDAPQTVDKFDIAINTTLDGNEKINFATVEPNKSDDINASVVENNNTGEITNSINDVLPNIVPTVVKDVDKITHALPNVGVNNSTVGTTQIVTNNIARIPVTNVLPANAKVIADLIPINVEKGSPANSPIGKVLANNVATNVTSNTTVFKTVTLNNAPINSVESIDYTHQSETHTFKVIQVANSTKPTATNETNLELVINPLNNITIPNNFPTTASNSNTIKVASNNLLKNQHVAPTSDEYRVMNTSSGSFLIPVSQSQNKDLYISLKNPTSADSTSKQNVSIDLTREDSDSYKIPIPQPTHKDLKYHCECCIVLRKIRKVKQKHITDYFNTNAKKNVFQKCDCNDLYKYPRISKRLKLFLKGYKTMTWCVHKELQSKLNLIQADKKGANGKFISAKETETLNDDYSLEDIASVTSYQLRLTTMSNIVRDTLAKRKIHKLLTKFNAESGDVTNLASELSDAFGTDLVNLYKEFLAFLTPQQAEQISEFRDYFVNGCASDLINRIDVEIKESHRKAEILDCLQKILVDRVSTSCQMCTRLLVYLEGYPKLAQHIFSLFPHRAGSWKDSWSSLRTTDNEKNTNVVPNLNQPITNLEPKSHNTKELQSQPSNIKDFQPKLISDNESQAEPAIIQSLEPQPINYKKLEPQSAVIEQSFAPKSHNIKGLQTQTSNIIESQPKTFNHKETQPDPTVVEQRMVVNPEEMKSFLMKFNESQISPAKHANVIEIQHNKTMEQLPVTYKELQTKLDSSEVTEPKNVIYFVRKLKKVDFVKTQQELTNTKDSRTKMKKMKPKILQTSTPLNKLPNLINVANILQTSKPSFVRILPKTLQEKKHEDIGVNTLCGESKEILTQNNNSSSNKRLPILLKSREVHEQNPKTVLETASEVTPRMNDNKERTNELASVTSEVVERTNEITERVNEITEKTNEITERTNKLTETPNEISQMVKNDDDDLEEDSLMICDDLLVMRDYDPDHSSSGDEDDDRPLSDFRVRSEQEIHTSIVKREHQPTSMELDNSEVTMSKTEEHDLNTTGTSMSTLIMSKDEPIKMEVPEWTREEDKQILQVLLPHVRCERKEKTILESLEDKNVYQMISDSLTHKTESEIKDRVFYLLEILVKTEF